MNQFGAWRDKQRVNAGHPDADGDVRRRRRGCVCNAQIAHCCAYFLRHRHRLRRIGVGQQDGKLFAAIARHHLIDARDACR